MRCRVGCEAEWKIGASGERSVDVRLVVFGAEGRCEVEASDG